MGWDEGTTGCHVLGQRSHHIIFTHRRHPAHKPVTLVNISKTEKHFALCSAPDKVR